MYLSMAVKLSEAIHVPPGTIQVNKAVEDPVRSFLSSSVPRAAERLDMIETHNENILS